MAQARDFKAEYRRRLERAFAKGLSRSQARGHARIGEAPLRPKASAAAEIPESFQEALKELRQTGTITNAAKAAGISRERLSRFLHENGLIKRDGRRWQVADKLHWEMQVTSNGGTYPIRLSSFEQASLNGQHQAAIGAFLSTNEVSRLAKFTGSAVIDANGKAHPLETNPNTLHRLAHAGGEPFHQVYRLTL